MTELRHVHTSIVEQMGGGLTASATQALSSYIGSSTPGLQKCITAKAESHQRAIFTDTFSDEDV